MGEITPLLIDFWFWLALFAVWLIAGFFVHKTKTRENFLQRAKYVIPLYAGFYLLFAKRPFGPLDYRLYDNNAVGWLGTLITAAGVLFATWARFTIGRMWSGFITLKQGHKLITTGPYAIARHPIYTGFVAAALGTAVSAARIDAFSGFASITSAFVFKYRREETLLITVFVDEYLGFKKKTPALFPLGWLSPSANQPIQSDAFQQAVLQSDRYRIIGLLSVCGAFMILDIAMALADRDHVRRYLIYFSWWGIIVVYETILLLITNAARRIGRPIRPCIWGLNTALECLFPSLALLGLIGDRAYLGPFRALVSSTVAVYFLFIILSTLRLSPLLCIIAGAVCSAGYMTVYFLMRWIAWDNDYRHFMPERTYIMYPITFASAGLLAAAVAARIRQHVIAALAEAETRRALDKVEYDLNVARSIQIGLLPKCAPNIPGYDIAGWSQPAQQTGGDYYDWLELPAGKWMLTIADVTGHGIGPALLAASCRASFRAIVPQDDAPERIMQKVDAQIAADIPEGRFITAALAILDPATHQLALYSAGHAPLYLYTAAANRVTILDADQLPLGLTLPGGDAPSKARILPLSPGDALILITDGFFECSNPAGQMLGISPLADFLCIAHANSAENLIAAMHQHVENFSDGHPQADDLTAVVIKRRIS